MWIILAFGSAFFAGITSILAKLGIKNVDSNLATALRTIVVLIFSCLMVIIVGTPLNIYKIEIKTLLFLILSGMSTGISWLCYFKALQIGDINKVTPIDKSSTIITMILAFIILQEKISFIKFISLIAIGIGTFLMIQIKPIKPTSKKKQKTDKWIFYAFGSAIFASLTSILGKIGIENIDSSLGTAIRTGVVLIMAWIMVFITKKQHTIKYIDKKSWCFLGLSGITTGASWLCYFTALQTGLASVIVPIDKLSIVLTVIFSYFIFKEKLNYKSFLGLILIIIGTLMMLL